MLLLSSYLSASPRSWGKGYRWTFSLDLLENIDYLVSDTSHWEDKPYAVPEVRLDMGSNHGLGNSFLSSYKF